MDAYIAYYLEPFRLWVVSTQLHWFMTHSNWAWPMFESLHFIGLSLLIGTVGLFDLRLMGVGKRIPLAAMHKLIPFGVSGYILNLLTGISFFAGAPDQYMYNAAFQFKMTFMSLAGLNVLIFYTGVFRRVMALGPDAETPLAAKIAGGASLFLWIAVLTCGRLLTFYRPAFFL